MTAAARAIAHLVQIRDEIELAARSPGELVTISRQVAESILNSVGVISCAVRQMSENEIPAQQD